MLVGEEPPPTCREYLGYLTLQQLNIDPAGSPHGPAGHRMRALITEPGQDPACGLSMLDGTSVTFSVTTARHSAKTPSEAITPVGHCLPYGILVDGPAVLMFFDIKPRSAGTRSLRVTDHFLPWRGLHSLRA